LNIFEQPKHQSSLHDGEFNFQKPLCLESPCFPAKCWKQTILTKQNKNSTTTKKHKHKHLQRKKKKFEKSTLTSHNRLPLTSTHSAHSLPACTREREIENNLYLQHTDKTSLLPLANFVTKSQLLGKNKTKKQTKKERNNNDILT